MKIKPTKKTKQQRKEIQDMESKIDKSIFESSEPDTVSEPGGEEKSGGPPQMQARAQSTGSAGDMARMKAALDACEAKAGLLDIVPTPVMAVDKEFNVTFMNAAGAQALGRTPDACVGQKCFSLFNTGHCNTPDCQTAKAMQQNGVFTNDTVAKLPSGDLPIRYTGAP